MNNKFSFCQKFFNGFSIIFIITSFFALSQDAFAAPTSYTEVIPSFTGGLGADYSALSFINTQICAHGTGSYIAGRFYTGHYPDRTTLIITPQSGNCFNTAWTWSGQLISTLSLNTFAFNNLYTAHTFSDGDYWYDFYSDLDASYYTNFTISSGGTLVSLYTPSTCSDGIQNQDETGIDTGGVCTQTIDTDITTSTTWDKHHLYIVSGDIEITSGDTLTIEPGTRIQFDDTTPSSLIISGTLNAIGSEGSEIIFNSNDSTPEVGDWGGITVEAGGVANFDYAAISHAGKTGTSEAGIYNNGGTISITNSYIVYSAHNGVKNSSGTTTIDDATDIGFNDYGIYKDGGTIIVNNSVIHNNTSYGVYNNTVSSIDAEDNYWGSSNGPSGFGSGSGDDVSDYVDFAPWSDVPEHTAGPGSVDSGEIRWGGSTEYTNELDEAISTWNDFGSIDILPDTEFTYEDLTVSDVPDRPDLFWIGAWTPEIGTHTLKLNKYYMDLISTDGRQNVITHELGHALGLQHSYTGNIMYFMQTNQIDLGPQDEDDYNALWL